MKSNTRRRPKPPGQGISIREYLEQPDRFVTRLELWELLRLYESGKRRLTWWRRVLRWAQRPVIGTHPPKLT